jgi:hypothetical protein
MPMVHRRGDKQKRRLEKRPPVNAKQNFLQKRFEVSRNNTRWLVKLLERSRAVSWSESFCPICLSRETESRHKGSGLREILILSTSGQRTFDPLDLWTKGLRDIRTWVRRQQGQPRKSSETVGKKPAIRASSFTGIRTRTLIGPFQDCSVAKRR